MDIEDIQDIAEEHLGGISWEGAKGVLDECPGYFLHSTPTKYGDCVVFLNADTNGMPTVFCFHQSCKGEVEEANDELREAVREAMATLGTLVKSRAQLLREYHKRSKARSLWLEKAVQQRHAKEALPKILKDFAWSPRQVMDESPVKMTAEQAKQAWRMHVSLFRPTDWIWIGDRHHSGPVHGVGHIRTAERWLMRCSIPSGQLICSCLFSPGSKDRTDEKAYLRPFLVLESDTLSFDESCALFRWCRQFLTLRAIVFSGNKSLHAWFDFPKTVEAMRQTYAILPALGFDERLIVGRSQPSRLAGAIRDNGRTQHLIWFDVSDRGWEGKIPYTLVS
jgi:hypothetical protein